MDKDAYYFPHYCNARHDRKIRRIIKELGLEGYGIFFMTLEVLREQTDLRYPLSDMDLLADEFNTSEAKVRTVVCNYKLFEVDEENNFFSPKLIFYLQPYLEGKEQRSIDGIRGNLIKYGHATIAQLSDMSNDEIRQFNHEKSLYLGGDSGGDRNKSKLKEIKPKERKEEESKTKAVFDVFRKAYPKDTRGLDVEFDYFKKTEKDYINVSGKLLDALNAQIKSRKAKGDVKEFVPGWKDLKTWIYNKCWTIEIKTDTEVSRNHSSIPKPWAYETHSEYEQECKKRELTPIPKEIADKIEISSKGMDKFLEENKKYT